MDLQKRRRSDIYMATIWVNQFSLLQEPSAMLDTLQQADVLYMC